MLKTLFATGALVAAGTSVAHISMDGSATRIDGRTIERAAFRVEQTDAGSALVSKDAVESLGGRVEVAVDGGSVTIEPGVCLKRAGEGFEISTHGRRPLVLATDAGAVTAASPAAVTLSDGGWTVAAGGRIEGVSLRASLSKPDGGILLAADETPAAPAPAATEGGGKKTLDIRRVLYIDPWPSAEPTDEQSVKRPGDVSPSGF